MSYRWAVHIVLSADMGKGVKSFLVFRMGCVPAANTQYRNEWPRIVLEEVDNFNCK